MVLSRKKLKQKLRSLIADSLAANESKDRRQSHNHDLQSVRELLATKSRRQRPNNRGKRDKTLVSSDDLIPPDCNRVEEKRNHESLDRPDRAKTKKRKRGNEDDGGQQSKKRSQNEDKTNHKKQKKQKQKKKKKKKKKTKPDGTVQNEESDAKKVYVGGIPYYSNEDDIRSFFQGCGTVTEVDCMRFPETGKFRGIAILAFKTEAAAKRALALDGADMGGFYLKIQPYKAATRIPKADFAPEIIEGYNRIYVGNLSWDVSEEDVKNLLAGCKISSIRFGEDKETGDFKGYAHVDFADSASVAVAMKLDQTDVLGRPVRIRGAVPKKGGGGMVDGIRRERVEGSEKENGEGDGSSGGGKRKKKRQTCYECGIAGHISSDCPRKLDGGDIPAASH